MNSQRFLAPTIMKKAAQQTFRGRAGRQILLSLLIVSVASLQSVRAATCLCSFDSSPIGEPRAETCCCGHCSLSGMQPGEEQGKDESLQAALQPSGGLFTAFIGEAGEASAALTERCQVGQRTENPAIKSPPSFSPSVSEDSSPISLARPGRPVSTIKREAIVLSGRSSPIYLATSTLLI
jgi:hypothetical protein